MKMIEASRSHCICLSALGINLNLFNVILYKCLYVCSYAFELVMGIFHMSFPEYEMKTI